MKRRRARPLLAGTLLTGALIGCGEAVSSPEPPEAVEVPTPLEHPLSFSIALPAEAAPSGPLRIRLFSETGTEPLAEHTTVTEGRNTTVRWKPEVALPERLRIEAVVFEQEDAVPRDRDYTATTVREDILPPLAFAPVPSTAGT